MAFLREDEAKDWAAKLAVLDGVRAVAQQDVGEIWRISVSLPLDGGGAGRVAVPLSDHR